MAHHDFTVIQNSLGYAKGFKTCLPVNDKSVFEIIVIIGVKINHGASSDMGISFYEFLK